MLNQITKAKKLKLEYSVTVHFGRVEEIDSGLEGFVEELEGLRQRVLLAECHGA